jgi:DNA repair exonuclease SbcCD ATPase subunit
MYSSNNSRTFSASKTLSKTNSKTPNKHPVIRNDNSIDTTVLQKNFQQFYKTSKEKLLKLKGLIEEVEEDNERQKVENNQLSLQAGELQKFDSEFNLRIKGMKEKLISAQKHKNYLQSQIKEFKNEADSTARKIDTMKIDGSYKVKLVQNDIEHVQNLKESALRNIKTKIDNELTFQKNIKEKIQEITEEINKYKSFILEINQPDSVRTKEIEKDAYEMTKFLSEL